MAAVVFAIGSGPGLSEHQAYELAELLGHRRSLAAQSAGSKIREQAERDPGREASQDVELEPDELHEVAAILSEPRAPEELPTFAHLRDEISCALGG